METHSGCASHGYAGSRAAQHPLTPTPSAPSRYASTNASDRRMALRPRPPPSAAVVSYMMHTQRSRLSMYDTNVSMISTTWKEPLMVLWYLQAAEAKAAGGRPRAARRQVPAPAHRGESAAAAGAAHAPAHGVVIHVDLAQAPHHLQLVALALTHLLVLLARVALHAGGAK